MTGVNEVTLTNNIQELGNGLSAVKYGGNYMFDEFLAQGGAASDLELASFLQSKLMSGIQLDTTSFGCSALAASSENGEYIFGRNFDWYGSDTLIISSKPEDAYASISTVNTSFIKSAVGNFDSLPDPARLIVSIYAPLDGMNEKGLCAAVLMVHGSAAIEQNTDKPDITTTTAIRLMLDKSATVDEAVALLRQYDMHASFGYNVHFALSDNSGKSAAVEYINNEMVVTDTQVLTNFYIAESANQRNGSSQAHTRFETLQKALADNPSMDMEDVKNAMESVSKHHFNDGETTVWSMICNQSTGEIHYYYRENFENGYTLHIDK